MNKIDLINKIAVVTGGAQGFGKAVAIDALKSGADVSLWDMDANMLNETKKELEALKLGKVDIQVVNITNYEDIENSKNEVIKTLGGIDLLFVNAGIAGASKPLWEYDSSEWSTVININLVGAFNTIKAIIPHMIEKNYGRIVCTASVAGKEGNPNMSAYSASKAGVIALTKTLAKETALKNIAVNCIAPATAETRILETLSEENIAYMKSKIPRERFLKVEELSAMVSWLFSAENSFTTGACFDLSGGRLTY